MPNQPKTGGKNIRIADDLWDRALAVAHRRGETLSQVIRAALVRYVKRHETQANAPTGTGESTGRGVNNKEGTS
jgi:predicted transcriptional regulator